MLVKLFSKKNKAIKHEKFDPLLDEIIEHVCNNEQYVGHGSPMSVKGVPAYEDMKNLKGEEKPELLFFLLDLTHDLMKQVGAKNNQRVPKRDLSNQRDIVANTFGMILKTRTDFQDEAFIKIFNAFTTADKNYNNFFTLSHWPVSALVSQIEKHIKKNGLSQQLKADIEKMLQHKDIQSALKSGSKPYYGADLKKVGFKLGILLDPESVNNIPAYQLGTGPFGSIVSTDHKQLQAEEQEKWNALFHHLAKATTGKPTKKWLTETKPLIDAIGTDVFKKHVQSWLQQASKLVVEEIEQTYTYANGGVYNYIERVYIENHSHNLLKGLLWSMSRFHDTKSLQIMAHLAEKCFQKIPGIGPAAAGVGNAAIYALAQSKGLEGVGHLSRLKLRIKQNNTQKLIQKYIEEQADKQGLRPAQIEESAAPDFGMSVGEKVEEFKDHKLVLRLTGIGKTELQWIKPDGKTQKSVPAFVKESKHLFEKLKKMRDLAKQVKTSSTAQRDRIDRLYTEDMSWTPDDVKKHYLDHGLVSFVGRKLIWSLDSTPALYHLGEWQDVTGKAVSISKNTVVRLWHPIESEADEVIAWRDRLEELEIQQPLKQAYREVYILTDAEINTRVYSNRMAAHFIKQHQFNTLAAIRGWKYSLLGAYDDGRDGEITRKPLPAYDLEAQFWINEVYDDNESFNDAGIWFYVATDQVRFHKAGDADDNPVELVDIPSLVLSEILRDVDLFVGVASVGNDPQWQDGGPDARPHYRDYWQSYSFGDLTEVAKTRKAVLERLLPRLKIRDVAHIDGKFLMVKGTKHTYKIHIGSGNILIAPNDQYLCIVPGRGKDKNLAKVFLPFEGDSGLSIVLSKAFLLAEDDKITDKTILSQI